MPTTVSATTTPMMTYPSKLMKTNDIATYPADEENLHDLYSKDCQCHPDVEVIGATIMYMHNRIRTLIQPIVKIDIRETPQTAKEN